MIDYVEEIEKDFEIIIKVVKDVKKEEGDAHITSVMEKLKKTEEIGSKWSDKKKRDAIMVAAGKGKLKIIRKPPNQLVIELMEGDKYENG